MKTVGVVGCGLMGSGIAQVSAQAGFTTWVREVDKPALDKGLGRIRKFLEDGVAKGKLTADVKDETLGRIKGTTELQDLATCDLVIEAVLENLDAKRQVFSTLDRIVPASTVLASNTSSLSITEIAATASRPERVLGLHFFNPVPLMKLVEVIRALPTSDAAFEQARGFVEKLGKTAVVAQDTPGFVVNRLLVPYLLDAARIYESGVASKEDIDNGMKLGCGYPMGPLTLLDFVGLDTTLSIANIMFEEFKLPQYAAPPLLKRMVLAGYLGRKSGRGFYDYSKS
ncbi:MAG TPA: 3-hydroxybutyryl-CoA dehydrogenase [Candidatus Eisenbacteria bacterium]|jgi:3-hydroxybutyryl-CoA dehydrogenase|nr:3-hydroxybutyryl-CoA dehydrogenase [Candidatus Eisenbacteria bacterium]HZV90579.1 3-hydroxybutyryl-CoA dehydrogenase [Candidatus Nitrosocosmicus sp.]